MGKNVAVAGRIEVVVGRIVVVGGFEADTAAAVESLRTALVKAEARMKFDEEVGSWRMCLGYSLRSR